MAVAVNVERKAVEVKWDSSSEASPVVVYALGSDNQWHNTAEMPNDGKAALSYPADFEGESLVEVRDLDGNVIDSGTIEVG